MSTILVECQQGSEEWFAARVGVITASNFADAISRLKPKKGETVGERSAKSLSYMHKVALERLAGVPMGDVFQSWQMKRGVEREPHARLRYEEETGLVVRESGVLLTEDRLFGYSTDGLVDDDGMVEIKCPSSPDQIVAIWRDRDFSEYADQIRGGLWLTGRRWCDLVVYVPELAPVGRDLFRHRFWRDDDAIDALAAELWEFAKETAALEQALRESKQPDVSDEPPAKPVKQEAEAQAAA